jgi:hypothetical protein
MIYGVNPVGGKRTIRRLWNGLAVRAALVVS